MSRLMLSQVPLMTTNYSRQFGVIHQATSQSTQMVKRRQENIGWEGVIGSLTFATITVNFELEIQGCCHMVPNQF